MNILIKLNMYKLSAIDLNLIDEYTISGFKISDWITDLQNRLLHVNRKEEERKLKEMEEKLTTLLSIDKQTELQISSIEATLKL